MIHTNTNGSDYDVRRNRRLGWLVSDDDGRVYRGTTLRTAIRKADRHHKPACKS